MKTSLQVLKFGGTSVGSGERIRHVAQIIVNTFNDPTEALPVIVVSAMSKVTDQLLRIAGLICEGQPGASERELMALRQRHLEAVEKAVHQSYRREALQRDLEVAFSQLEQDVAALRDYRSIGL